MQEAVLLAMVLEERQFDLSAPRRHCHEARVDGFHEGLAR
jgi:hypothetical protein